MFSLLPRFANRCFLTFIFPATQELKVLVDRALISAGESVLETDRISDLHTSCLGFAPLIFDLKETDTHKVDFAQVMIACESVWNVLEADPRLPRKLVRNNSIADNVKS